VVSYPEWPQRNREDDLEGVAFFQLEYARSGNPIYVWLALDLIMSGSLTSDPLPGWVREYLGQCAGEFSYRVRDLASVPTGNVSEDVQTVLGLRFLKADGAHSSRRKWLNPYLEAARDLHEQELASEMDAAYARDFHARNGPPGDPLISIEQWREAFGAGGLAIDELATRVADAHRDDCHHGNPCVVSYKTVLRAWGKFGAPEETERYFLEHFGLKPLSKVERLVDRQNHRSALLEAQERRRIERVLHECDRRASALRWKA
jgi:hypothetical protein